MPHRSNPRLVKTDEAAWWMGGNTWLNFGLLIFFLIVFLPVLAPVLDWIRVAISGDMSWTNLLIPSPRRAGLLFKSVTLASAVALFDITIAVLASSLLWRWRRGWGGVLRWSFLILAPIPPYVQAIAWDAAISATNIFLQAAGMPVVPFKGWAGSWWVQCMAWLPLGVGLALLALEGVESAMVDAARIYRNDLQTLFRIVLPLAAPMLLAGAGFLFLMSLMDYSVPSYFGLNVYALELFAEFSAYNDPMHTWLLSLPLLLVAVLLIILTQKGLRRVAQTPALANETWGVKPTFPYWFWFLQAAALLLLLVQTGFTLGSLVVATGTWKNLFFTLGSARNEILTTFRVGLLCSLLGLPAALAAACQLVRKDSQASMWWLLVTIPLAFPPTLVGIGLISIWNNPLMEGIYTSILLPVMASMARFTSLAAILMQAQLHTTDPLSVDAARLYQRRSWFTWVWVRIPMLAPGLAGAACLSFALTISELGATLMVVPAGQNTITLRIYNYLHYGATSEVAGLCLLMVGLVLAATSLAALSLAGWRRISALSSGGTK